MEGRARAHDNLFVARLWRSVQDEAVCLKDDPAAAAAAQGLGGWFDFYNPRRPRQSFDGWTPAARGGLAPPPGAEANASGPAIDSNGKKGSATASAAASSLALQQLPGILQPLKCGIAVSLFSKS
jgi:hypothetical protein